MNSTDSTTHHSLARQCFTSCSKYMLYLDVVVPLSLISLSMSLLRELDIIYVSKTFKIARYVVFNDAIRVDRMDTNDKDNNYYYNMVKTKRGQVSVG